MNFPFYKKLNLDLDTSEIKEEIKEIKEEIKEEKKERLKLPKAPSISHLKKLNVENEVNKLNKLIDDKNKIDKIKNFRKDKIFKQLKKSLDEKNRKKIVMNQELKRYNIEPNSEIGEYYKNLNKFVDKNRKDPDTYLEDSDFRRIEDLASSLIKGILDLYTIKRLMSNNYKGVINKDDNLI